MDVGEISPTLISKMSGHNYGQFVFTCASIQSYTAGFS